MPKNVPEIYIGGITKMTIGVDESGPLQRPTKSSSVKLFAWLTKEPKP